MTPEQLRHQAFQNIETAKKLVQDNPRWASYTVGYGLEFILKARFCEKVGLPEFPEDRAEARRLQVAHAYTHDLSALLRLSDDVSLDRGGMLDVDWGRAMDWDVARRYEPSEERTTEQVAEQIAQTERACIELCHYDIITRLRDAEVALSDTHGPFTFFAFVLNQCRNAWETVIAFWPVSAVGDRDRQIAIRREIDRVLDAPLRVLSGYERFVHPHDERLQPFYILFANFGYIEHSLRTMTRNIVVEGYPPMPPAWMITCVNRPPKVARKS